MIQIMLDAAKERIPTMTDEELAQACGEVMRLQVRRATLVNPTFYVLGIVGVMLLGVIVDGVIGFALLGMGIGA